MRSLNYESVKSEHDLDWLVAAWNRVTLVQLSHTGVIDEIRKETQNERHDEIPVG